ncbi:MAG TPA: GtrA family protein [Candidatus Saccharimonadales bacterium]|nr:GtrA family protein [Candidatus Saccharimonadales bacterium]
MAGRTTFKSRPTFLIFCAVGAVNTLVDLVLYVVLKAHGLPVFAANTLSTSAALAVSFLLNKRFTFDDRSRDRRAIIPFLIVTLGGIWILQPVIIYAVQPLFELGMVSDLLGRYYGDSQTTQNVLSKLAASGASLVWNFYLYRRFVFKPSPDVEA